MTEETDEHQGFDPERAKHTRMYGDNQLPTYPEKIETTQGDTSGESMTGDQRPRVADPLYETACDLAHGFCCGNCDRDQAHEWRCDEDGCCSLRDGIFEEMRAAVRAAKAEGRD